MRTIYAGSFLCRSWVLALVFSLPLSAQTREATKSEVELPLSTYDALRAQAKEKKAPEQKESPFASARLLRSTLTVDVEARRARWETEIAALAGGDPPAAVKLLSGATAVSRSSIAPEGGARLDAGSGGTQLVPEQAGSFRVVLAGEIAGQGEDEVAGIRFALPRLACLPAAFDFKIPAETSATVSGGSLWLGSPAGGFRSGRVTLDRDAAAVLSVTRAPRAASGPPQIDGTLHTVVRLAEKSVRTEVRLTISIKRGLLAERKLTLPPGALVSVTGPVLVDDPKKDGTTLLRFEPPVGEGAAISILLALVTPRESGAAFTPGIAKLALGSTDRLENELTVVAEGGLVLKPQDEGDFVTRKVSGVSLGPDDTALSYHAAADEARPPVFAVRELKALAVASALARVTLSVYVGESGLTRTRAVASVRTRGRTLLAFRVPEDAELLACRSGGAAAPASRPAPNRIEVPINSDSGQNVVELLLGRKGPAPKVGEKLTIPPVVPEEPTERVSWQVVLPPGLEVKEEGKQLPSLAEPPAEPARPREEPQAAERAAAQEAGRIAAADRRERRDGAWSPLADLPNAPTTWATDLSDIQNEVPPLTLTIVATKEKNPWF